MNDYKELLKELRKLQNLGDAPIGREFAVIVDKLTVKDAADVIEQLVRERDAAVADLREAVMNPHIGRCEFCKYRDFKSPRCGNTKCRHGVLFSKAPDWDWQWRGVKEDIHDG